MADSMISASETPVIEFRGVSKTYTTGTHALEDVNIRINNGEFVFIVGSSGAGKSTFMKLIMREEKANTGKIIVNGFDLMKMRRRHIPHLRRTMGIVFQDFRLIPTMNVFQNVAFAMRVVLQHIRVLYPASTIGFSHKVGVGLYSGPRLLLVATRELTPSFNASPLIYNLELKIVYIFLLKKTNKIF